MSLSSSLAHCLSTLPHDPGVYRMLDIHGTVLYVGKAQDLKKRVSQYFQKTLTHPKTVALVQHIHSIEITVTPNENDALLLENQLIKTLQPKYNLLLRDDKSYPYLLLHNKHAFPSLRLYRGKTPPKTGRLFGPYPNTAAVHATLNMLQKCFQLRQCQDSVFRGRHRPCLQYQMKRCSAPCTQFISKEDYAMAVQHAIDFLEGKSDELLHTLSRTLQDCVTQLSFEKAAQLRDQIQQLRQIQHRHAIPYDLEAWGPLATQQALSFSAQFDQLATLLNAPAPLSRLECFDVSHTRGEATIASCVVFYSTGPEKSQYRHFTVHPNSPGDDYAALAEALQKRFSSADMPLPDLVLIDGGRGQVHVAQKTLAQQQLAHLRVLGITKGLRRQARYDRLYDPDQQQFLSLEANHPALLLLQRLRDEAHRFAITAHRKKRDKARQQSPLEAIPGIGPKRRRALLIHFGGLQALQKASYEALLNVPGISPALAKRLIGLLRQ